MNREQKTIVVAEDDVSLLAALKVRLESAGYAVIGVQDAYHALECCRRHHPAAALMDVNLPAGSGTNVHERMRADPVLRSIPVVYLTGDTRLSVVERAEQLGAVAIIHKPVDTAELLAVLEAATDAPGALGEDAA